MRRVVILASFVLAVVAFLLLAAARRGSSEIAVERDLVYGKGGNAELKLDLAMPKTGDGPFPAIVFLHGEGWRAGNRRQMSHFAEGVARMGYVGGLAGEQDGLEGEGGNAEQSSRVQAVVSFFGPTDFSTRDWPRDLEKEVIVPFLGGSLADWPDVYRRASPIGYVTRNSPPFLLIHSAEDELVPVDQSKRLAAKLRELGVPVRLVILEREKHGFTDAGNQESMKTMMQFLAKWLSA